MTPRRRTLHDDRMLELPPRFALLAHNHNRAFVFDAFRTQRRRHYHAAGGRDDEGDYIVRPHISDMRYMPPAFLIEDEPPRGYREQVSVQVDDSRYDIRFRTDWRYIGASIFSMMDAVPIPVIEFARDHDLPCLDVNWVRTIDGGRRERRLWERRWDPHTVTRAFHSDEEEEAPRRVRTRPTTAAPAPAPQPPPQPQTVPKFVADALIRDAVSRSVTCPITMEPLNPATTAVTSCFHLFDRDAIAAWLATADNACAVCKQRTVLTL